MKKQTLIKNCDSILYEILILIYGKCVKCGKKTTLVPSHCFGKKAHPCLRHELCNVLLLCDSCHKWWHAHPKEAWSWFKENQKEKYEQLMSIKTLSLKLSAQHYEDKLEYLNCLRGRIKEEQSKRLENILGLEPT